VSAKVELAFCGGDRLGQIGVLGDRSGRLSGCRELPGSYCDLIVGC